MLKEPIVSPVEVAGSPADRRVRRRGFRPFYAGCWAVAGLALLAGGCATVQAKAPPGLKAAFAKDFHVGAAVDSRDVTGRDPGDVAIVLAQFNSISPTNAMKWERIQPRPGPHGYDFRVADAYVAFGERHHMLIIGHTLVWHKQTPAWVFERPDGTPLQADNPADRALLLKRLHDHIMTVVGRYKGRVKIWDVVNEAVNGDRNPNDPHLLRQDSPWVRILGLQFIVKAFEWAHEADPNASLRYNDYSIENEPKRGRLIKLIKILQARHVPVMAIGSQTHATLNWPGEKLEDAALTDIAKLGLPIDITELDVNGARRGQHNHSADIAQNAEAVGGGLAAAADRKLTEQYVGLFRAFLKHRREIRLVTFWGVTDRTSWRRAGHPLLFDWYGKPKPAYRAVMQLALHPPAASD